MRKPARFSGVRQGRRVIGQADAESRPIQQYARGPSTMPREYVEIAWGELMTALLTLGIITFLILV
jgi:hypothetical protein